MGDCARGPQAEEFDQDHLEGRNAQIRIVLVAISKPRQLLYEQGQSSEACGRLHRTTYFIET